MEMRRKPFPSIFIHGQNFFLNSNVCFSIKLNDGVLRSGLKPKVGAHYFISLSCEVYFCTPLAAWEVDGTDFRTAKFIQIRFDDDAAVQWFMHGQGREFYSVSGHMFARTPQGDVEIYPHYPEEVSSTETRSRFDGPFDPWPALGVLGALLVVDGIVYFISARSRKS